MLQISELSYQLSIYYVYNSTSQFITMLTINNKCVTTSTQQREVDLVVLEFAGFHSTHTLPNLAFQYNEKL